MTLRYVLFWACVALAAAAELLIIRSAFAQPGVREALPAGAGTAASPQPRRGAEIAWALVPPVALAAVFWAAWRSLV